MSAARSSSKGDKIIKDGKFWVPLIGLFSGMRLGEIVQLQRTDLRLVDGTWVFDINLSEDGNKKVKTGTSLRQVPVHKTLIAMGLVEHQKNVPSGNRLFPDISPAKMASTATISQSGGADTAIPLSSGGTKRFSIHFVTCSPTNCAMWKHPIMF